MWMELYVERQRVKIFVSHIDVHQIVSTTEKAFNNQVDRMLQPDEPASLWPLQCWHDGLMNEVVMAQGQRTCMGPTYRFSFTKADLATDADIYLNCQQLRPILMPDMASFFRETNWLFGGKLIAPDPLYLEGAAIHCWNFTTYLCLSCFRGLGQHHHVRIYRMFVPPTHNTQQRTRPRDSFYSKGDEAHNRETLQSNHTVHLSRSCHIQSDVTAY